jgi:predicted transcriptional regulator
MMVNRGRLDIMAHILGLCTKPQRKTRIMYDANITFNQFGSYATLLQSQGLLNHEENTYVTTEKGLQFVNAFNQLKSILSGPKFEACIPNRLSRQEQEMKEPPTTIYV